MGVLRNDGRILPARLAAAAAIVLGVVVATPGVRAAPGDLTVSDHEGQLQVSGVAGSYSNGNITEYAEQQSINFRFDLDAAVAGSGTLELEFSGNVTGASGCTPFFEQTFSLGTHDGSFPAVVSNAGATPTVSLVGATVADGDEWSQTVSVLFAGAGSATVYYHLTLSSVAGDCSGSSQHSRIGTTTGDFAAPGSQNVPVPANDVLELPDVTVIKLIDRDGNGTFESTAGAGEFCFSLDGGACVPTDGSGQVVFAGVPSNTGDPADPHQQTVTETQLDFSQGTYVFASGSGTNCVFNADIATATVQAATSSPANATCTFNNEIVRGNIVIEKQTLPDGDPQQFTFTPSYGAPFQLADGQTDDSGPLVPGNYSVAETVPAGWVLTAATCDDGSAPGNITLDPAETVTCTFTNTKDGKIVVEKQTQPDGDPQTFDFSGDLNGTIGDGGMLMVDVAPGQYTVTEDNIPAGWTLTDIACDDGNSSGAVGAATATFNVEAGETVTCTFTNTKDGKIVVEKQTQPDGDPQTFDFSGDLNGTIGDGGMLMVDVAPGQYTVTEDNIPAGWTLASVQCDDLNSVGDAGTATATFNVEPGETVNCTFNNTSLPTIVVQKQTLPDGDAATFAMSGAINATLGDGDSDLAVVAVGQHQVSETVPAGWVLTSINCNDADSTGDVNTGIATFNVSAGEVVTCVFTNTKNGSITVEKQTLPDGDPQQFAFAGDLAGQIPDNGSISLPVPPGQYASAETVPAGWVLSDITCDDGNSSGDTNTGEATFNVEPGEHVTCVFTNTKNGRIVVQKQAEPPGTGQLFTFSGVTNASIPHNGQILIDVAPGSYVMAETVPAGWQLTDITCDDANSSGDTVTAEATFEVEAGETVTCVFTNTQEGSVTIVKDALPPDGTDFTFDGAFGPFALDDDADATLPDAVTFGGLLPGSYPVSETVPAGWELIGLACDDGSTTDLATATATIDVSAGEDVTCTFVNSQLVAGLTIEKTPDSQDVVVGSAATFDISVTNTGAADLTAVTVTDPNAPNCASTIGDLASGAAVTYQCTLTITDDVVNVATVAGLDPAGAPVDDVDDAFVNALPTITVAKSGPASQPEPGGVANFAVTVTNTSAPSDPVTLTSLVDDVYGDVTALAGSTCAVPQVITPGGSYQCTFSGSVAGQPGDTATNTVTAMGADDETSTVLALAQHTVTITDVPSALQVTKSAQPASVPAAGAPVTFSVTVRNTSQVDAVTITKVTDDVFGDVSSACAPALPHALAVDETLTCGFVRTVTGSPTADHHDVATATGTDDDGVALIASGAAFVDILPPPPSVLPGTGGGGGLTPLAIGLATIGALLTFLTRRSRLAS